jgi:RsiW-degrading membrane proteinase PrsW (M82 family)
MTFILLTAGALLPAVLLLWIFYTRDLNPEPRDLLLKTFLRGVLATIIVLILGFLPVLFIKRNVTNPLLEAGLQAFLIAGFFEEFLKYRVLTQYSAKQPAFNEPMDGVVYGVAASLGFAALENLRFVNAGGWTVAISRALTAVPAHACWGAIIGYYVGQARFISGWPLSPRRGLWIAALIHGMYDFPLIFVTMVAPGELPGIGLTAALVVSFSMLIIGLGWTIQIVFRLRREQSKKSK